MKTRPAAVYAFLLAFGSALLVTCSVEERKVGAPPAADLSPDQLIARTLRRYQSAASYRDSGTILTRIDGHEIPLAFSTSFQEPAVFALQVSDERGVRHAIRSSPDGTYLVTDRHKATKHALEEALGGLVGVSSGYSTMIPPMLLGSAALSPLSSLRDARITGTETVHGERCSLVSGTDPQGRPFEVWIGDETFLVRRSRRVIDRGVPRPFENQLDYHDAALAP